VSGFWSGAVFRLEMRLLLLNPATVIFLAFGWVLEGFLAFYLGARGGGHAVGPLGYVPWVFVLLLPALVMNIADDARSGRAERLLTLPITANALWVTRFAVYWLVAGLFLLGTWPLVASAAWLGQVATPAEFALVAKGYGALALLGGVQLALAFWPAAECTQAVVAFLCGFLLNLALVAGGWGLRPEFLRYFAPGVGPDGFLGESLALFNMLAMPLLAALAYGIYRARRRKSAKNSQ
jgi:ABC-2 type transport system permease protein